MTTKQEEEEHRATLQPASEAYKAKMKEIEELYGNENGQNI